MRYMSLEPKIRQIRYNVNMKEVNGQISKEKLKQMAINQEAYLLEQGSKQENLWGINIYPELTGDEMIEFDSMINLRPSQGNNSRVNE